jgi:hypothetical protein
MTSFKRLVVIDPGFAVLTGHHYSTALTIAKECDQRNIECVFFTSRDLAYKFARSDRIPGAETALCRPELTEAIYLPVKTYAAASVLEVFLIYSEILAVELESRVGPYCGQDTRLLCHTANAIVIYAVSKWLARKTAETPGIVLNVQHSLDAWEANFMQYAAAQTSISAFRQAHVFGSNAPLCRLLSACSGLMTHIFPLPLSLPSAAERNRGADPCFCVAGEARSEKNLAILPEAIRRYFSAGGRGTFNIQLQPMPGQTEKLVRRDLPRLQSEFPDRVNLLLALLYGDAFYEHIAGSDAVLLTYPGQAYQNRVSQIALEAAAFGVSCIAARHSSMEEELARLDNGSVFMEKADAECLAAAMLDFGQNLAANRARAAEGGKICRAYHNADTYFDIIADAENFAYPDYARIEPHPPRRPLPGIQDSEECTCAS